MKVKSQQPAACHECGSPRNLSKIKLPYGRKRISAHACTRHISAVYLVIKSKIEKLKKAKRRK